MIFAKEYPGCSWESIIKGSSKLLQDHLPNDNMYDGRNEHMKNIGF